MRHYFNDGTYLDFSQPYLREIPLEKLLFALSREFRFANQTSYSVLEHSLAVGKAMEMIYPGNVLLIQHGYLHDIGEAIFRDVATPIKEMVGKKWYDMENTITTKLFEALGVGPLGDEDFKLLKEVDRVMCYVEALSFFPPEKGEFIKTLTELRPEILVYCTNAFNSVYNIDIIDQETHSLNPEIIGLYKQIIFATIM